MRTWRTQSPEVGSGTLSGVGRSRALRLGAGRGGGVEVANLRDNHVHAVAPAPVLGSLFLATLSLLVGQLGRRQAMGLLLGGRAGRCSSCKKEFQVGSRGTHAEYPRKSGVGQSSRHGGLEVLMGLRRRVTEVRTPRDPPPPELPGGSRVANLHF